MASWNPALAWGAGGTAVRPWGSAGKGSYLGAERYPGQGVAEESIREGIRKYPGMTPGNTVFHQSIGKYLDKTSGNDFTGWVTGYGGQKLGYAKNGVMVDDPSKIPLAEGQAELDAKRPKLRKYVEQQEVADYAQSGLKALPGKSAKTLTAFDQLLDTQNKEIAKLRETAPEAYDTSGTEAELRGADAGFRESSGDVLSRKQAADAEYIKTQNAIQQQKADELARYSDTRRRLAQQQVDAGTAARNAAQVSAGGNQGWGGADTNRAARLFERSWAPAEAEISGRRTGLLGEQGSLEREYLGNENATFAFEQGLNEKFAGNTRATAQYLQSLKNQMRNLSVTEQEALLRREAENLGLGQRLRAGEINMAQLLAALERSSTKYAYEQPFDPSRMGAAGGGGGVSYPETSTSSSGGGGGGGGARDYTGGGGAAQKTWYQMTPDEQRAYMNQRQLAQVNAGRQYWYGPGQGLNSLGDIPKTLPGGAGIGPGTPAARDWETYTTA